MSAPTEATAPLVATPSQTVGPFFHLGLIPAPAATVQPTDAGDRISIVVQVLDGQGAPVPDAMLEIWQVPDGGDPRSVPGLFGRMATSDDGTCTFETIRPRRAPDGRGGWQAAHINVCLLARGLLRQVHTRLYFAGDPALEKDAVMALVPEDRRSTLIATPDAGSRDRWLFPLRLQGPDETVFFDI